MRLTNYLSELWMTNKINKEKFEVLKNPSVKEMRELVKSEKLKEVRFISDNKTKNIYVWYVNLAIHSEIYEKIYGKLNYDSIINDGVFIFGLAELKGGKFTMSSSDLMMYYCDKGMDMEKLYKDSKWVNSYIKVDEFIKTQMNYSKGK